jgi:tetratricopeptide (TPR) repeat protein
LKRGFRKQIKQDEFVSFVEHVTTWVSGHRDETRLTAVVVAVLAIGAGSLYYFQHRQRQQAERAFSEALEAFQAPVTAEQPPGAAPASGPRFATANEKFTQAAALFDGVERRYGSLEIGRRARYYSALCRLQIGKLDEAAEALAALATDEGEHPLDAGLARLAQAEVHRLKGEADKAAEAYQRMIDDPQFAMPRDYALMSLASLYDGEKRYADARASYRRLYEEFPSSPYAAEARRRAQYLENAPAG